MFRTRVFCVQQRLLRSGQFAYRGLSLNAKHDNNKIEVTLSYHSIIRFTTMSADISLNPSAFPSKRFSRNQRRAHITWAHYSGVASNYDSQDISTTSPNPYVMTLIAQPFAAVVSSSSNQSLTYVSRP